MLNDTQIPAARVDVTEPNGSIMTRPWFRFFSNLYNFIGLANGAVPTTSGGTGLTAYNAGDILYAPTANVLARLPAPGVGVPSYLGTDGTNMPQWINVGYGAFDARTTQSASANTPAAVVFNTTSYHNQIDLGTPASRVVVTNAGTYNMQFSVQLQNASNTDDDDVTFWFKVNNVNIGNSASVVTVPKKHAGIAGSSILTVNLFYMLASNNYVELYWMTRTGTSQIITIPATTSPSVPEAPGVIFTMNQIV